MNDSNHTRLADLLHPASGWADVRVVVGRLDERSPQALDELRQHGEQGGSLLIVPEPGDRFLADLAGVDVEQQLTRAEWFLTLAERAERARLESEVPVSSPLHILRTVASGVEVAATTSHAYNQRAVLAVRKMGLGLVLTTGVVDLDALLSQPTLGRFVRRLLERSPAPARHWCYWRKRSTDRLCHRQFAMPA